MCPATTPEQCYPGEDIIWTNKQSYFNEIIHQYYNNIREGLKKKEKKIWNFPHLGIFRIFTQIWTL